MKENCNLRLTSGYILPGLAEREEIRANQITLTFQQQNPADGARFVLYFDPNACSLDSFGDPQACTKMLGPRFDATLRLLESKDGKHLFAIDAAEYRGPSLRLALVPEDEQAGQSQARLLVIAPDEAGTTGEARIERILPLRSSPQAAS